MKPLRVRVLVNVVIDQDAWASEYGIDNTTAAVKQDVTQWVSQGVRDQLASLGLTAGEDVAQ